MTTVSVADLPARMPELLKELEAGQEITVTQDSKPVAKLMPATVMPATGLPATVSPSLPETRASSGDVKTSGPTLPMYTREPQPPRAKVSRYGSMKGRIWIADDFDAPLEDFAEYM